MRDSPPAGENPYDMVFNGPPNGRLQRDRTKQVSSLCREVCIQLFHMEDDAQKRSRLEKLYRAVKTNGGDFFQLSNGIFVHMTQEDALKALMHEFTTPLGFDPQSPEQNIHFGRRSQKGTCHAKWCGKLVARKDLITVPAAPPSPIPQKGQRFPSQQKLKTYARKMRIREEFTERLGLGRNTPKFGERSKFRYCRCHPLEQVRDVTVSYTYQKEKDGSTVTKSFPLKPFLAPCRNGERTPLNQEQTSLLEKMDLWKELVQNGSVRTVDELLQEINHQLKPPPPLSAEASEPTKGNEKATESATDRGEIKDPAEANETTFDAAQESDPFDNHGQVPLYPPQGAFRPFSTNHGF